jgi:molybdopterin molybdotransferase
VANPVITPLPDLMQEPDMALISVEQALARLTDLARTPTAIESVDLMDAAGRVLAAPLKALRTNPPFNASAMDGYAIRANDLHISNTLNVIGEAAAGHPFSGHVRAYEAVRIFTGAPVPDGADTILIQENVDGVGQSVIVARAPETKGRFIRNAGLDFKQGDTLIETGTRLDARRVGLAAAMGHAALRVHRRPRVGILATGDELVVPGAICAPGQIISSNTYALAALVREAGGEPINLGIARDTRAELDARIGAARAKACDLLITLGGASIGDHDLVQSVLTAKGMALDFWKIAMRPGKPLMAGTLERMIVVGLPGNPVSSIICGMIFVQPLIRLMQGDQQAMADRTRFAVLGQDMPANDQRQDYVRGHSVTDQDGTEIATPLPKQDSSMLSALARANVLILRAPFAPAASSGASCLVLPLDNV